MTAMHLFVFALATVLLVPASAWQSHKFPEPQEAFQELVYLEEDEQEGITPSSLRRLMSHQVTCTYGAGGVPDRAKEECPKANQPVGITLGAPTCRSKPDASTVDVTYTSSLLKPDCYPGEISYVTVIAEFPAGTPSKYGNKGKNDCKKLEKTSEGETITLNVVCGSTITIIAHDGSYPAGGGISAAQLTLLQAIDRSCTSGGAKNLAKQTCAAGTMTVTCC